MAERGGGDGSVKACPCGSGRGYAVCCRPLHLGQSSAPTAEALMRSRFSAFAVADAGYLLRTWHPSTRPADLELGADHRWTRLQILGTDRGGLFDTSGLVEFRAHYRHQGRSGSMQERSRFVRDAGDWLYLDAEPPGGPRQPAGPGG
jgi:SEC-C motif-containing protein